MDIEPVKLEGGIFQNDGTSSDYIIGLGLKLVQKIPSVQVAIFDLDNHTLNITEFQDNIFLFNLETMLLQYLPEDRTTSRLSVILFDQTKQPKFQEKVKFIFEEQGIEYEIGDIQQLQAFSSNRGLLETLLKEEHKVKLSVCAHERSLDIASICISHFKKLNYFIRKNVFDFTQLELNRFMRLDFPVYKALDLISTVSKPNQGPNSKTQDVKTLLDCLDTCKTKPGHKTLRRWIAQPLAVQEQIETRLTVVEFLVDNTAFRNYLKNTFLAVMPDLESISVKFFKIKTEIRSNAGNLYDAIKIYNVSKHIETLCAFFKSYTIKEADKDIVEAYFISPVKNAMVSLEKFQAYVEKTIDLAAFAKTHELQLHATTSPEISELHAKLAAINTQLNQERLRLEKLLGLPVTLERTPKSPVMLQTSKKAAATLAKHPDLQIKTVRAHQLRFTSPLSNSLSSQLLQTQEALQQLQATHTSHIMQILASYYPVVEDLAEVVAEIDAFVALADFSALPGRCRPAFNDGSRICLMQAVHPVLESRMGRTEVVPNDCVMVKADSGFVVVTGPNMGGKSTYLRQVALNIILGQIGCFVCASAASLPVFTGMVARIGAGDIQSRGVSTWMAELLEVSCMLQFSSHNTFLLIDELGRGTSTAEGVGMTWALAEHILNKMKCYCLFATHFFELTKLADLYQQVKNCHVDFSLVDASHSEGTQHVGAAMKIEGPDQLANIAEQVSNRIRLNYKILPGATDSAFGVQILHMMKFPTDVIQFAQKKTETQGKTMATTEKSEMQPEETHQVSLDEKIEVLLMVRKLRKQIQAGKPQQAEDEEVLKRSVEQLLTRNRIGEDTSSGMKLENC